MRYARNPKNSTSLNHSSIHYIKKKHKKLYPSLYRKRPRKRGRKLFKTTKCKHRALTQAEIRQMKINQLRYQSYYQQHKAEIDFRNRMYILGTVGFVFLIALLSAL